MAAKTTPCRVVAAFTFEGVPYTPNQVVEFSAEQIAALKEQGVIDSSKAAVEYCLKELGAKVLEHGVAAPELE